MPRKNIESVQLPFCFPLAGFLQSVSPFLEAPEVEHSLVDLFSAILEGEIGDPSKQSLFSLSDLRIISDLHSDVLSTPSDQLISAFTFVKTRVLGGKPFDQEHHTRVALELKKFLTSSSDERQKALHEETLRQEHLVSIERERRVMAEKGIGDREAEIAHLRQQVADMDHQKEIAIKERKRRESAEQDVKDKEEKVAQLSGQVREARRQTSIEKKRGIYLRLALALVGTSFTCLIWYFDSDIVDNILGFLGSSTKSDAWILPIIRFAGSVLMLLSCAPAVFLLRQKHLLAGFTIVMAVSAGGLGLLKDSVVAEISGYLAIGWPLALAFLLMMGWLQADKSD